MASSYYKLEILERTQTRTPGSRAIRREGLIPGVLYYSGEENVNIAVDKLALFHAMQSGQRIFEIEQDGSVQFTMIKELISTLEVCELKVDLSVKLSFRVHRYNWTLVYPCAACHGPRSTNGILDCPTLF